MGSIRICLAVLGLCLVAGPALAQTMDVKIAILDVERVYITAAAAKTLKQDINAQSLPKREALAAREKDLLDEEQQLARQRAILSQEVFAKKAQELREEYYKSERLSQKVARLQRDSRDLRAKQESQLKQGLLEIQVVVRKVVKEIADEQGFDLIMANRIIMLQANTLDITQEILARLDKQLPKVSVPEVQ